MRHASSAKKAGKEAPRVSSASARGTSVSAMTVSNDAGGSASGGTWADAAAPLSSSSKTVGSGAFLAAGFVQIMPIQLNLSRHEDNPKQS